MRICIIGKFPPIQGGVSMRTYWTAHALAARGHEIHVVTNAKEAQAPFRMHMRAEDWERCDGTYDKGSVTVHWTDPVDRSQSYIPMASPFVSKLAGVAARVHRERPFDVIYSHYLEPYGVAAHLAAQMTRVPHVVRMAGSDAGRLWHHPQLEPLYDHVLRSAELVIAIGSVADRAIRHGVDPNRIAAGGAFVVPDDLFTPEGRAIDLAALRVEIGSDADLRDLLWGGFTGDRPYVGVYGKLGETKGSFALLSALHQLNGLDVGLVALAHGGRAVERHFRERATELGLERRILQIPYLPHWRVPEFLRGCLAVCCLEQDFPIRVHAPIIPREVLLSGTCLVASTELLRKLPAYGKLPHGYGCVAIEDVNDTAALSDRLAAIVQDAGRAAAVGRRGRAFVRELQQQMSFPHRLEQLLQAAAARRHAPSMTEARTRAPADDPFGLTRLAAIAVGDRGLALGARIEVAIAEAQAEADRADTAAPSDPLFRLRTSRWAMGDGDLAGLVPVRDPLARVIAFDFDVSEFIGARSAGDLPATPTPRASFIVAFGECEGERRDPLVVDGSTARILMLSDGTLTASQIIAEGGIQIQEDQLDWIESLFVQGLISLREGAERGTPLAKAMPIAI